MTARQIYNKQYYEDNKEKRKQQYYEDNKEGKKQYYENNKERKQQYYEDNKERIKENGKQYYEDNKEKKQQYYEDNKEWIKERIKERDKQCRYERREEYFNEHGCYPPITSDNNMIYIWEVIGELWNNLPIFKIGVTSERLGEKRIHNVRNSIGCKIRVRLLINVQGEPATHLENRIHNMLPIIPNMGDINGKTEFRSCSYSEMDAIVEMIEFDEKDM